MYLRKQMQMHLFVRTMCKNIFLNSLLLIKYISSHTRVYLKKSSWITSSISKGQNKEDSFAEEFSRNRDMHKGKKYRKKNMSVIFKKAIKYVSGF